MSSMIINDDSEKFEDDDSIVKKINKLFNSSKTRQFAWKLLNTYLPRCPEGYFLEYCVGWMQNSCKIDDSVKKKEDAINLLSNLFKISKNYPELKKAVSFFITSQYFDFFFKYLINTTTGWECMRNCLLFYNGSCGSYLDELQKQLSYEINKNLKISMHIAECFALLPCIGGGGVENTTYKTNWKTQFLKHLTICHSILNDLYRDAEEINEVETPKYTYNKSQKYGGPEYLVNQLYNYISILNCMLLNQYPSAKSIPPDQIFQLICRGLAVNPKSLIERPTAAFTALRRVLCSVHIIFLSLLKSVVVACKNLLLPYAHLICKLIKQILERADADFAYGGEKSLAELKVAAYEALCNWLAAAGNGSCMELVSSAVLSSAMGDIVPKKAVVFLTANRQSKGEASSRRVSTAPDSKLCFAALKTLQFCLKFGGVSLKPEEHKFLQETVVLLLLEIQKTPVVDVAVPFDAPDCRKELYCLLLELVHQPSSKWPPPTHFALELFGKGVNDASLEVSSFCSGALNLMTIIIHSQYDNGGFSPCEMNQNRNPGGMEIVSTEKALDLQAGRGEGFEENVEHSTLTPINPGEKLSDVNEEIRASSDEDSRTTVPYAKESEPETVSSVERKTEKAEDVERVKEKERGSQDDEEETSPLDKEEQLGTSPSIMESNSMKYSPERSEGSQTPQGSTAEETHPRKRYFLRSKTKGSSNEFEDCPKLGSSPESGKSPPLRPFMKSTPKSIKTRALLRKSTVSEMEAKEKDNQDNDDVDEENLKACFADCLVD